MSKMGWGWTALSSVVCLCAGSVCEPRRAWGTIGLSEPLLHVLQYAVGVSWWAPVYISISNTVVATCACVRSAAILVPDALVSSSEGLSFSYLEFLTNPRAFEWWLVRRLWTIGVQGRVHSGDPTLKTGNTRSYVRG